MAIVGRVQIRYHKEERRRMAAVTYQKFVDCKAHNNSDTLDVLWKTSLLFGSPRPAWSVMMQFVHHGDHPGKASAMFLTIIDMNSSDTTYIYSTLAFVTEHARRHDVAPIITFDQPLWWKALMIIRSEPLDSDLRRIVLRLGGLHTEMSFRGCIGHVMASSGLQELLELIYAPNAVVHMLSGKAIARAVRAHFIVDAALNSMMLTDVINAPLPIEPDKSNRNDNAEVATMQSYMSEEVIGTPDLDEARVVYEKMVDGTVTIGDVCESDVLNRIKDRLHKHAVSAKMSSRTGSLWVQYMGMVDFLRKYIRAERTGNWALHLQTIQNMFPYLAASGHNLYTKSARVYLQQMANMKEEHPDAHQRFEDGLHVIRRSDRLWAGLSSDLIIEQDLTRSMKTSGGLTRGRGLTEQQRLLWLL